MSQAKMASPASTAQSAPKPSPQSLPRKGPLVECCVCHEIKSQKSIKSHFIRKHKDHDYEEQRQFHEARKRLSKSPKLNKKKAKSTPSSPAIAHGKNKSNVSASQLQFNSVLDRSEVIVACVICFEMMSTKSMKNHFARHHPDHDYQALKPTMSSASPMRGTAELVTCSACKKTVSCRTLKVHILKNHPDLDYKTTLKESREEVVKVATPGPFPTDTKSSLFDDDLSPTLNGYHSEPRIMSKNQAYPCILCQKEVIFQNMKKHFNRIHPEEMDKYLEMKALRTAERAETSRMPKLTRISDPLLFASLDDASDVEVNNNADEDYAPSALLKEIEQEMTKEYGMDPYSRLLSGNRDDDLQVHVTEQVIRFEGDGCDFTEINPPSSKLVPASDLANSFGETSDSRKRKISEVDIEPEEQELYKRLATENYMLERQILYLQEQEQFLERKMVTFKRVMERRMQEFEDKLRSEFEEKSRKLMGEIQLRELKMKEKMIEHDRWLSSRLEEQRQLVSGGRISPGVPTPPASDDNDKSDSSTSKSSEDNNPGPKSPKKSPGKASPSKASSSRASKKAQKSSRAQRKDSKTSAEDEMAVADTAAEEETEADAIRAPTPVALFAAANFENDMDQSYETETETEDDVFAAMLKKDGATTRRPRKGQKSLTANLKKSTKQPIKKKKKLNSKLVNSKRKRVFCHPCARSFRDQYDYKKHCNTKVHLQNVEQEPDGVANGSDETELENDEAENITADENTEKGHTTS